MRVEPVRSAPYIRASQKILRTVFTRRAVSAFARKRDKLSSRAGWARFWQPGRCRWPLRDTSPGQVSLTWAYNSRSALITSSRTARIAGSMPPKMPMTNVIRRATPMTSGPKRNETVIDAKLLKSLVS